MSFPQYDDFEVNGTKYPVTALAARLATMASQVVAIALIHSNDVKIDNGYVYTYNDFTSYKYLFYVTIVGAAYTVLQLPFAFYYMLRKKHLINHYGFLKFDFYADKVVLFLLATAAGAAFGATADLNSKNIKWQEDNKLEKLFNVAYVSAAFVLVGCLASGISSVHSSLALAKAS